MKKSIAYKSLLLAGCGMLIAVPAFATTSSPSMVGDDHFVIMAQGVPGAPQGGSTGTGGNSGVGDHDAGTDRANTYDTPSSKSLPSSTSSATEPAEKLNNNPVNSTTSGAMNSTTSGSHRGHHHRGTNGATGTNNDPSGDSGAGNGMPKSGNSY